MSNHGAEVGVDWENGLVLHENDTEWHAWDDNVYGMECPPSQRVDGKKHSWKWASDGPYVECHYCGELQDAMNGTVITPGRKS